MLTLQPEWFILGKLDYLSTVFVGNRDSVGPFDVMRIEHKLTISLQIVEDCHPLVSNDSELLFLERVQPAHENVRLYAALEITDGQRSVRNMRIQIAPTVSAHSIGNFTQQLQHHRNIVRRKTPQNIFLRPEFAQIKT